MSAQCAEPSSFGQLRALMNGVYAAGPPTGCDTRTPSTGPSSSLPLGASSVTVSATSTTLWPVLTSNTKLTPCSSTVSLPSAGGVASEKLGNGSHPPACATSIISASEPSCALAFSTPVAVLLQPPLRNGITVTPPRALIDTLAFARLPTLMLRSTPITQPERATYPPAVTARPVGSFAAWTVMAPSVPMCMSPCSAGTTSPGSCVGSGVHGALVDTQRRVSPSCSMPDSSSVGIDAAPPLNSKSPVNITVLVFIRTSSCSPAHATSSCSCSSSVTFSVMSSVPGHS
mmetsp:Transcript_40730/g.112027  ORF Transcript_40730/g.112027 Transcript_40730/m.112027 type:complete len:287 (+) Transcript_40730:1611-2471(+)